jgi:hypothetical protein
MARSLRGSSVVKFLLKIQVGLEQLRDAVSELEFVRTVGALASYNPRTHQSRHLLAQRSGIEIELFRQFFLSRWARDQAKYQSKAPRIGDRLKETNVNSRIVRI